MNRNKINNTSVKKVSHLHFEVLNISKGDIEIPAKLAEQSVCLYN